MPTIAELTDLSGRTAVITGGAGYLGRTMAKALLAAQCRVVLIDKFGDPLDGAQNELKTFGSAGVSTHLADLENEEARVDLARDILNSCTVDILINNAGFVGDSALKGWTTSFADQSLETWRRAIEVNLTAPFHLTQLFSESLAKTGKGSVINISSIYGLLGPNMTLYEGTTMGNPAAYAASKGGLLQLTRWLATTLAPHVRVNSITPGGIERGQPESFAERYVSLTPMARMGKEEDFIGPLLLLASDQSSWMTGQNIIVDGGWSAW